MDIMGLSKRMFQQLGPTKDTQSSPEVKKPEEIQAKIDLDDLSPMGQRVATVAQEFNVKQLPMPDVIPLQTRLTEVGLIQSNQVRAQGLLTQLAYKHQKAGPINMEKALENHLDHLNQQGTVLADYKEGKQLLNTIRNLISAREQHMQAS